MKIKIIDLFNKIANGEEIPKKVIYRDKIWKYTSTVLGKGYQYYSASYGEWKTLQSQVYLEECLNDEVEIIEEPEDRIERAVEFLETQYNTYPSGEMWRGALKNILQGKSADDVYESFIEEDKKIGKIGEKPDTSLYEFNDYDGILEDALDWNFKVIEDKINILSDALIDVVNKLKED